MSDHEAEYYLNKDVRALADAKSFLSNYNCFMKKAVQQYEKDDLVRAMRHHMKALIRIGLENMP